ncbi:uncharacterized protein BDW43DRAFT_306071 [Aspergillus alliaceus]|uniref:uncharacterized protein n=1 Tax=Petromyces alliaceus TaxID=209559 RepID=UPI0012A6E21A|nr:uncharacterized protein BDW43DRAFT_306071 [Aspergillus alliaceus]KAB8239187.1 hypothetical protein BDW43DRAFT_306071 [Aspergillus alliaceus]
MFPVPLQSACARSMTAFAMDTGLLDSHADFGINAPPKNRIEYRRLTTCSPIYGVDFGTDREEAGLGADIVVGNDKGLALAQTASEAIEILRELRQLREQRENLNRYEKIARERFLLTYKRDKLHNASDNECRMIERANIKVHGGDALADAELYDDYGRRDYTPKFEKLLQKFLEKIEAAK